jgi:hypothetical protein
MSDGPHRSLPMPPRWKDLAKYADKASYTTADVCAGLTPALAADWKKEVRAEIPRLLSSILGGSPQGDLLSSSADLLEALDNIRAHAAGYGLQLAVIDWTKQAVREGLSGEAALVQGTAYALEARCASGNRQVEEHYLRDTNNKRASHVRARLEAARASSDFAGLARSVLAPTATGLHKAPAKHSGLDEGPKL